MNIATKLIGIEWIKLRKRPAFWVAIVIHATVLGIRFGGQQYAHLMNSGAPAFKLPDDWVALISTGATLSMLMLFIGVALLTSSETTWRTQRQNVIDGLSRGQYFAGKFAVAVFLAVILWFDVTLLGLIIAPLGGHGGLVAPVFSKLALQMLPNALLYMLALAATAFFIGMIAPSSGAALGILFGFFIVSPILTAIMSAQGGAWPSISRFLPLEVYGNLISRATYDPEVMKQMSAVMTRMKRPLPLSLHTSIIATAAYTVAFVAFAWATFRSRDL